jgi:ABC-2 type transport system permease protein
MWKFIQYEIKFWLKSPMTWILFGINVLLIGAAVASESITIGGSYGSVYKNAPYVVQNYYAFMSIICLFMTTAFMSATALRDYQCNIQQLIFSSPIKKREYFFGKFIGASVIALIPMLSVSVGVIFGSMMPWVQAERFGPFILQGHLVGILGFAVPNVLFISSIIYAVAIFSKNQIVPYMTALGILVLYIITGVLMQDLDNRWLSVVTDPLGFNSLDLASKYYTVADKNSHGVPLRGDLLINRLLWISISLITLFFFYLKFSFSSKSNSKKAKSIENKKIEPVPFLPKSFVAKNANSFSWESLFSLTWFELRAIIKHPTFIIIAIIGLINLLGSIVSFEGNYGAKNYPVTYDIVDRINGSYAIFIIAIIIFYSGQLVWRDREAKMSEIKDATPTQTSIFFLSKFFALCGMLFILQFLSVLLGIAIQTTKGYTNYNFPVYFKLLLGAYYLKYVWLATLALFFHYLINNRYIAYFAVIAFSIVNAFVWNALKINSLLVKYGSFPRIDYSDMNQFSPYQQNVPWYAVYWTLGAAIIAFITYFFYTRGKEENFKLRLAHAKIAFRKFKFSFFLLCFVFISCCSFIYYNTRVLNKFVGENEEESLQIDYEKKYKKYENIPQPTFTHLDYHIDLKPETAEGIVHISCVVKNTSNSTIDKLYITEPQINDSFEVVIPNANLLLNDAKVGFRIYALNKIMQPNDSMKIEYTNYIIRNGFKDQASIKTFAHNGTFFSTEAVLPLFGYISANELDDKFKRIKYKLPVKILAPKLDSTDMNARSKMYFGGLSGYVTTNTIFSTAPDQTAIAPGSLIRSWDSLGRKYFQYQLDRPSVNFYSFLSARYKIVRKIHQGVSLEVYYHEAHAANVPNVLKSLEKSFDYYTKNFGPYYHKQMRIIEFPKYSFFAQSFPGTMPYSEGIGFIADLRKADEDVIDGLYYIVAHEVGHQWWAHQVIGCNMEGSVMLSETFAQYSALMVMEKAYGKNKMKKFLKYELDDYLTARGSESKGEVTLDKTTEQAHVYYQKGSMAMYYLKEMIGEEKVNIALRSLVNKYAYSGSPYPTSLHAIAEFKKVTPDSLQYIIKDLFQDIILFDNRIESVKSKKIGSHQFEVSIETFSEKMRSDSLGTEKVIPLQDYIDIGIFAKSESKTNLGKTLFMKRIKFTQKKNKFTFLINEEPYRAGIDPYNFLVDRIPDDNVKIIKDAN